MLRWVLISDSDAIGPFADEGECMAQLDRMHPRAAAAYQPAPMFEPAMTE